MAKKKQSRIGTIFGVDTDGKDVRPDWSKADNSLVLDVISLIGNLGGAIRFGYTRDRTSYSIGIYLDDDSETFYCGANVDIDHFLEGLKAKLENIE